ncbi:MAG: H-X9-DG-CTERM domain-containing protein [Armatimonadota bacterium]
MMYVQDHEEVLPLATEWNQVLGAQYGLVGKVWDCPTSSSPGTVSVPDYFYVAGSLLSGMAIGDVGAAVDAPILVDFKSPDRSKPYVVHDTSDLAADILKYVDSRHNGGAMLAYVDGHVGWLAQNNITSDTFFPSTGRTSIVVDNYITASYTATTGGRNDITGTLAYRFTPVADITIEALGRVVIAAGMSQNHTVQIWRVSDQRLMAGAIITPTSSTDTVGFKYKPLFEPVTLRSGVSYYIGSSETSGGDKWLSDLSLAGQHRTIATISGLCYANGPAGTYPGNYYAGADTVYGPATFYTAK